MSNTVQAVRFERPGGPAVLSLREVTLGRPGPGQARIKHAAVGINFIDTQFRAGAKRTALPSGIGVEAAGIVADIGEGVTSIRPGARVTYATGLGAYSTENIVAADALIELPPSIAFDAAAAMTLRGLGAGYLLRRMGSVARGDVIAVHAAAGGLGLILVQSAKPGSGAPKTAVATPAATAKA